MTVIKIHSCSFRELRQRAERQPDNTRKRAAHRLDEGGRASLHGVAARLVERLARRDVGRDLLTRERRENDLGQRGVCKDLTACFDERKPRRAPAKPGAGEGDKPRTRTVKKADGAEGEAKAPAKRVRKAGA